MDISIVIPVYNAERHIVKCLDSVFSQEFDGTFEVVAVNDASTDGSLMQLLEYQKKVHNLTVLSNDINRKLPYTRSRGMSEANGKYILNVDADDWILPGALQTLYQRCEKEQADILVFDITRMDQEGNLTPARLTQGDFFTSDKERMIKVFLGSTCNKFVRRELTKDLLYSKAEVNHTEDVLFAIEILLRAGKMGQITQSFYIYTVNLQSITRTTTPTSYISSQFVILKHMRELRQKHPDYAAIFNRIYQQLTDWLLEVLCFNKSNSKEERHKTAELLRHLTDDFPEIEDNRAISKSSGNNLYCMYCVWKRMGLRKLGSLIKFHLLKPIP